VATTTVGDGDDSLHDAEDAARVSSIWEPVTNDSRNDTWATSRPEEPAHNDDEDDPFIAELRRAITDTTPLGPRDDLPEGPPEVVSQPVEQEVPGGRRFRRKRR
jgi:hypothetical protein